MPERKFAVIGHPIGHTMSPFIHRRLFELADKSGEYIKMDIAPEELENKLEELDKLSGYNITIPNKQRIIPFLDSLDKKARLYGSVNTVSNCGGRVGYTTDPDGFLKALESAGIPFSGKVCIAGCGGAARTFVYEAALAGCSITVAVRPESTARRDKLIEEVRKKTGAENIRGCLLSELEDESGGGLFVNGTPVGMFPEVERTPVPVSVIKKYEYVFDAVYNPLETRLVSEARANGAAALGGMSMLVWQAVVAHEIWDGSSYDIGDINKLINDSAEELKKNF